MNAFDCVLILKCVLLCDDKNKNCDVRFFFISLVKMIDSIGENIWLEI